MLLHTLFTFTYPLLTAFGQRCKSIPSDPTWPSQEIWRKLNETVGGSLISTVPLASVCHSNGSYARFYDDSACSTLKQQFDYSEVHFKTPAAIMPAWFQETCNPFSPTSQPCELGNYASYSINVSSPQQVIDGLNFSKAHNVRLVIKNTGHDIIDQYTGSYYKGPAIRLGAGVIGLEAQEAANAAGYRVVGGNCPSVGIAGGYSQGGGHSSMSNLYGMAADNILEWEVVTATGDHLVATPETNSELYWALSGGGGGTYAVVLSMTSRLHDDGLVGGGYISFDDTTIGSDKFWEAVTQFNARLPSISDQGGVTIAYSLTNHAFAIYNLFAEGQGADSVRRLLNPYLSDLDQLGVTYNVSTHESPSFLEQLRRDYGPFPDGPFATTAILGGRLIPREVVLDTKSNTALTQVLRDITQSSDYAMLMQSIDVRSNSSSLPMRPVAANAVLPAWRSTIIQAIFTAPWNWTVPRSEMEKREKYISEHVTPTLQAVTPSSGSYMNEGNFRQPDWQNQFFGSNYDRLLAVKQKYDPDNLFYAPQAVGSEYWEEDKAGRLLSRYPSFASSESFKEE
ncbi:hypothetical protein E0Z10_g6919 [Xylaria hypoxylon]|uniref:FAD-binding PCMH-type domain-containing protein n=1 Tax=Xylaria hypoxylon TaxID=37992 RepID=A0A4Z0YRP5_9PEZI|nr:hypothetical protein E0Z10_g6919 [Xylaria hypoxylon]